MSKQHFWSRVLAQVDQKGCISFEALQIIVEECFDDQTVEKEVLMQQASVLNNFFNTVNRMVIQSCPCEELRWKLPTGPDFTLFKDADELSTRMRTSRYLALAFSSSNSLIDIVLCDRISAHSEALAAEKMTLHGEHEVRTTVPGGRGWIMNTADYVLGLNTSSSVSSTKGIAVLADAKSFHYVSRTYCQFIPYMLSVQQRCVESRSNLMTNDATYEIVTDGIYWEFFRLAGNKLNESGTYDLIDSSGRGAVYRFMNCIIKSSNSIAPTPA